MEWSFAVVLVLVVCISSAVFPSFFFFSGYIFALFSTFASVIRNVRYSLSSWHFLIILHALLSKQKSRRAERMRKLQKKTSRSWIIDPRQRTNDCTRYDSDFSFISIQLITHRTTAKEKEIRLHLIFLNFHLISHICFYYSFYNLLFKFNAYLPPPTDPLLDWKLAPDLTKKTKVSFPLCPFVTFPLKLRAKLTVNLYQRILIH